MCSDIEDSWRAGDERKSAELSFNPLIEKIAPSGTAKVNDLANRMKSEVLALQGTVVRALRRIVLHQNLDWTELRIFAANSYW